MLHIIVTLFKIYIDLKETYITFIYCECNVHFNKFIKISSDNY